MLLDDLQWSDGATLELLSALAAPLRELPLLVVAAYRSDEIGRGHPLRRLRADLRRGRLLREIVVAPLDQPASTELAARVLGGRPSPALAGALYDRTQGVPFFVQELAAALQAGDRVIEGAAGLELEHDDHVPVPETIRDAVLLRTAGLSPDGRAAAEAAAVAGADFGLDLVAGLDELLETGLVEETEPGRAAFRHALVRGAIYEDIQWLRRRELHAQLAQRLTEAGAPSAEIAAHWLAAGDADSALDAFLASARELAAVHAHRDAAQAALQALDLWPEGTRPAERLAALDAYAHSAELAGDLAEAARALREAAAAQRTVQTLGDDRAAARRALRPARRPRPRAHRAAGRRRLLRRRRAGRRGGGRAAARRRLPRRAPGAKATRSSSPWPPRERGDPRRADRPARAGARARGRRARQARRVRGRRGDDPRRAVAGARARADRRGRRALPAARHGARDARPTTAARARRCTRRSACARPPARPGRSTRA